jgi:hypothetical protein
MREAYEITMLSVCLLLITFQPSGRFHEIQQRGHAMEDDLDTIIFNPIASTILKWQTFKLLRQMHKLVPVNIGA